MDICVTVTTLEILVLSSTLPYGLGEFTSELLPLPLILPITLRRDLSISILNTLDVLLTDFNSTGGFGKSFGPIPNDR